MPPLAAMFELLVSAVPYAVVDDIFAGLFRDATRHVTAGVGRNSAPPDMVAHANHLANAVPTIPPLTSGVAPRDARQSR